MTNQFKFGDLVRCEGYLSTGVIIGVNEERKTAKIFFDGINITRHKRMESLELIPHPDTVRLDYIERIISIDGMVKREMRKGWNLFVDDIELTQPEPLLRDAIDEAMHLTAGNKP
ncbi:MAG: hypothetical protein D8H97_31575 [Neisseria sp.]|nr:MAG: hypothetical protein D8H97_31575 [Neisseria sp.]